MLKERLAKPVGRHFSLLEQAKALAVVLKEEFGVPFVFYESTTAAEVWGWEQDAFRGRAPKLHPVTVASLVEDGRARVTTLPDGGCQLAIVLYEGDKPILMAVGEMLPLARLGPDMVREQLRLQKWLQAVADRLRLSGQLSGRHQNEDAQHTQATTAWEAILTLDHLLRRLRIHKDPSRNQSRILEAAFGMLGVQTLIWVPHRIDVPVFVE